MQFLLLDDETLDQVDGGEPGVDVALLLHLHDKDSQTLFRRQYFDAFVRFCQFAQRRQLDLFATLQQPLVYLGQAFLAQTSPPLLQFKKI